MNVCHICKQTFVSRPDIISHLEATGHIKELPSKEHWDQPEYLFSTFEDDTLLCLLNDDAYEDNVKVIAEQFDVEMRNELSTDLKNLLL